MKPKGNTIKFVYQVLMKTKSKPRVERLERVDIDSDKSVQIALYERET